MTFCMPLFFILSSFHMDTAFSTSLSGITILRCKAVSLESYTWEQNLVFHIYVH